MEGSNNDDNNNNNGFPPAAVPPIEAQHQQHREENNINNDDLNRRHGGGGPPLDEVHRRRQMALREGVRMPFEAGVALQQQPPVATQQGGPAPRHNFPPPEREVEDVAASSGGWAVIEVAPESGPAPSPRSLHAGAVLNNTFYVFGGYTGSQRTNSFHAFSFTDRRWVHVLPSVVGNHHPQGDGNNHVDTPIIPPPRDRHVAVAYGNSFYIHGGFDGTSRVADFWAFDFSTMAWRQVNAFQGRPPSARHSHCAVVYRSRMYVIAGYDGSYKNDMHEFDFTLSRWTIVNAAGRRPRPRYRATAVVHKNIMILHGGHDGTRHLSDTYLFDFGTRTWSSLITHNNTPPMARDSHVCAVHGNAMYLFGGSSGSAMSDLWELSLPTNDSQTVARWRRIQTSTTNNYLQPRHRFCHVGGVHNDDLFIFGGYDGSERLNDFIKFDFAVYDMSLEIPESTILSEMRALVNSPTFSDVQFIIEGDELNPVYAHKIMLLRCSYFETLFLGRMKESSMSTIRIEQVSRSNFLAILEYVYTDHLDISAHDAMEIFMSADLFGIPRLQR